MSNDDPSETVHPDVLKLRERLFPPTYNALRTELDCPLCAGEACVRVRDRDVRHDGSDVDAFCTECGGSLFVTQHVDVSFSDPR